MWQAFTDFLFRCDTRYAELLSGLLAMGWGITLWRSGIPGSPQTSAMAAWAPLWFWGLQFILLALVQIVGALFGWEQFRRWSGLFLSPFWVFLFVIFMTMDQITGTVAYGGFALTCSWVYLRLANKSGLAQYVKRRIRKKGGTDESD